MIPDGLPRPLREHVGRPPRDRDAGRDAARAPVWVDHDGGEAALVNTAYGRRKTRNLERTPKAGLSVVAAADPYRYVSVRGPVTLVDEGADDHIDALARRYLDVDEYPYGEDEPGARVIVRIAADRVVTDG